MKPGSADQDKSLKKRALLQLIWVLFSAGIALPVVQSFIRLALTNDGASVGLLIPFLTIYMLYAKREVIFSTFSWDAPSCAILLILAGLPWIFLWLRAPSIDDYKSTELKTLSLLLIWCGGFALFFGSGCLKRARFPLTFLLLTVPIPEWFLNKATYLLQLSSAAIVGVGFDLSQTPVLREGFVFHFSTLSIEIAKECSGIRSTLAMLVISLVICYLCIENGWRQLVFVLTALFVSVTKNAVRICVLTLLALRVDPSFLHGNLHHDGGIFFFLFGLALMWPVLLLLRKSDGPQFLHFGPVKEMS